MSACRQSCGDSTAAASSSSEIANVHKAPDFYENMAAAQHVAELIDVEPMCLPGRQELRPLAA